MFVTAEGRPLKAFGRAAGYALERLLSEARIELRTGMSASVPAAGIVSLGKTRVEAQRIVTLPRITGPALAGIPAGMRWFVPVDERCVVTNGGGRVFAAGDDTDFPVKHGGIAAQQADTAAEGIVHLAGLGDRPDPLRPVIRGMLLTGPGRCTSRRRWSMGSAGGRKSTSGHRGRWRTRSSPRSSAGIFAGSTVPPAGPRRKMTPSVRIRSSPHHNDT